MNALYDKIKTAKEDLRILRGKCSHQITRIGEYEWTVGHVFPAVLCEHCDECIRPANDEEVAMFYKSSKFKYMVIHNKQESN